MTAVGERTALCVKRTADGRPCTDRPVVRYVIGTVCAGHQVPGAQVLEWLVDPAALEGAREFPPFPNVDVADNLHELLLGDRLPDPGREKAAAHVDGGTGEQQTARLVAYKAGKLRAIVLERLVQCGPRGTTAIEAWRWYQAHHNKSTDRYSIAPRLSELKTDGWASLSGEMRNVRGPGYPPEEVYVLSARGRREKGLTW